MPEIYQIEPSYDDLAFEPELTWKEFKYWCEDFDILIKENYVYYNGLYFYDDGDVVINAGEYGAFLVSKNRTYKQMQEVIKNLYEE